MFPQARNSLRRFSATEAAPGSHPKIPIPIGVSLENVLATESASTTKASSQWLRPRHETNLLPLLRLEIVVVVPDDDASGDSAQDTETRSEKIVYSSSAARRSVQPAWEHLDERIDLPERWWSNERVYQTMRLRIQQLLPPGEDGDEDEDKNDNNNDHNSTLFLEVPIYPAKLERLQDDKIPDSLPPNSCLVYFSDGSTRIPPSLFSVLLESQLAEPAPLEDFSRFEDDVFHTLDGVPQTPDRRVRAGSVSALLEPNTTTTTAEEPSSSPVASEDESAAMLMDEFDRASGSEEAHDDPVPPPKPRRASSQNDHDATKDPVDAPPFADSEHTVSVSDTEREKQRLEALIALEENRMEDELALLKEEREALASLLQEAKDVGRDIVLVHAESKNHKIEQHRDEFLREAQTMKLLKELQTIYPITLDPKKGYVIRNLRLPVDIYTTAVPEQEVSAALGFCCHLVYMVAKYLSISLRYRLVCNSSRSVVQLDGATFYPLFLSRSVDREQVDRGLSLLGADVDCILMSHGIQFTPKSHVLARLKRVYDHIIEGELPLSDNGMV